MTQHKHKIGLLVAALALAAVVLVASMGAVATPYEGNITAQNPDEQAVEVDVSFSGDTDVTAELSRDGSVLADETVSGIDGDSETIAFELTGYAAGEFELDVTATDDSLATVDDTRLVAEKEAMLDVEENETVLVDVEFDADEQSEAVVTLTNDGVQLNQSTIEFDPVKFEDGTGIKTTEWDADGNYSALNATIETSPAASHSEAWVSVDSGVFGGSGIVAGASRNQILGFLAVVVGLVAAYNRDYI